ncbi:hypothetical protein ACO1O0_004892 [Amphichorda felina]
MSSNNFASHNGFGNPGGLASRRGGQNIKPLSFDTLNKTSGDKENAIPTPRTSRSHLLAGLRTAPKSATASSFGPASPATAGPTQQYARSNLAANVHGIGQDNIYNAPKTAFPQYGVQHQQQQQRQQQHQQHQQQPNNLQFMMGQQYTVDQVLAPPELSIDEQAQEQMDPNIYAQLVATNMYLAAQQQRLQQQLRSVQAAAQQFQQLNLNNPQLVQQQMAIYEQQQQLRNMQQQLGAQASMGQSQQQFYYNPMTGQYYVDTSAAAQMSSPYSEQPMTPGGFNMFQQQQAQQQQFHSQSQTPRVQVSPPPENHGQGNGFRSNSPPKRHESPTETQPLPPPSANAYRRGHKKASSLAPVNATLAAAVGSGGDQPSAGPKSAAFPMTPLTGGYGPGQGRAGEHPIRQPRGPPSMDELKLKPTAKHEGSKNFAARTRRSAVHNLVRAGLERRKGTGSSAGSMSPVSETAEESTTPITDNDSESGRSGSGSLIGEEECSSSRKYAGGSWGAIGSDRPSSRQKARKASESEASNAESDTSSFANVFKKGALRASKAQEATDGQRRPSRLVLTSAEKRKTSPMA